METLLLAALGILGTAGTAIYTNRSQRLGEREARLLEAKVQVYGDCARALYGYERVTYNRVKARLAVLPGREEMRQEAYKLNAQARAAIGQVAILADEAVRDRLEASRRAIGDYNAADSEANLQERQRGLLDTLDEALKLARADLSI